MTQFHSVQTNSFLDPQVLALRMKMRGSMNKSASEGSVSWNSKSVLTEWLKPHSYQSFIKNYLDKKTLHTRAKSPDRFEKYIGFDSFRQLLKEEQVPASSIRIFDGSRGPGIGMPLADYGVRQSKLFDRLVKTGHSVWLRDGVTDVSPGLRELYSEVLHWTGQASRMNLFFTPRKSQTFIWHWDPVDAMSLQLHGRKQWTLYERPFPLPLSEHRAQFWPYWNESTVPATAKLELRQGDMLYFPRGVPHLVKSPKNHDSLHLTIVLIPVTHHDLVQEIVTKALLECEQDIEFRKQLHLTKSTKFSSDKKNHIERLTKRVFERIDWNNLEYHYRVRQVLKSAPEDFDKVADPTPPRKVSPQAFTLPLREEYKKSRLLFYFHKRGDFFEIIAGKQKIILPLKFMSAVAKLSESGVIRRANLARAKLNSEEQDALLNMLFENGLIRI